MGNTRRLCGMAGKDKDVMRLGERREPKIAGSRADPEGEWRFYLSGLPAYLGSRIVGQPSAIARIARAVQAAELGLNEGGSGPKGSFLFLGPTGVGKSFVACALAQKACRDGYSALYTRAAALFRDLAIARADGSLRLLLAKLSRIDAGDR